MTITDTTHPTTQVSETTDTPEPADTPETTGAAETGGITDTAADDTAAGDGDDVRPTDGPDPAADGVAGTGTSTGEADASSAARVAVEIGELLVVDPRVLVVGVNTRRDPALDRPFLRSIADRGVREPIIARRAADGTLVVRKGKRRTMAAVQAGRPTVPVLVEPGDPDPDTDAGELDRAGRTVRVERIVDQLEENQHRTATNEADEVHAHQQLLDLGLTAGQIARRTHVPTARVKVTAAVARSELAAAVLGRYDVTLDQAAVIAELDDGTDAGTTAAKVLTVTAAKEPAQFAHVAQQLRDERADTALVAAANAGLIRQGIALLDPNEPGAALQISGLREGEEVPSGTELTAEAHAGCPGHAASVEVRRRWGQDPALRVVHWCTDPTAHGHVARWTQTTTGRTGTGGVAGPMSEEDKAQRRLVIANNKAWDSATTVRRQWLRTFLARKTAPRDAQVFIAASLGRGGHDLRKAMESGHPTACEILGFEPVGSVYTGRPSPITEAAQVASPARATQLALAVLLGAAEDATGRQTWRSPEAGHRAYFTALRGWGYPLSPVEELVLTDSDQPADVAPHEAADDTSGTGDVDGTGDADAANSPAAEAPGH